MFFIKKLTILVILYLLYPIYCDNIHIDDTITQPCRIVVFSINNNPFYSFFAPIVTYGWKTIIGFDPIVFVSMDVPDFVVHNIKYMGGRVIKLNQTWPDTTHMMQNVRTHAAALEDLDENCIITTADADMMPLDKNYFSINEKEKDSFNVHGNHPGTLSHHQYPICYLTTTVKMWRKVMNITNLNINITMKKLYKNNKNKKVLGWGFDQSYVFKKVKEMMDKEEENDFNVVLNNWNNRWRLDFRINRNVNYNEKNKLVDSHLLRPGFTKRNWPRLVEGLLNHIFNNNAMKIFHNYRNNYIKFVMKGDDEGKELRDGFGRRA